MRPRPCTVCERTLRPARSPHPHPTFGWGRRAAGGVLVVPCCRPTLIAVRWRQSASGLRCRGGRDAWQGLSQGAPGGAVVGAGGGGGGRCGRVRVGRLGACGARPLSALQSRPVPLYLWGGPGRRCGNRPRTRRSRRCATCERVGPELNSRRASRPRSVSEQAAAAVATAAYARLPPLAWTPGGVHLVRCPWPPRRVLLPGLRCRSVRVLARAAASRVISTPHRCRRGVAHGQRRHRCLSPPPSAPLPPPPSPTALPKRHPCATRLAVAGVRLFRQRPWLAAVEVAPVRASAVGHPRHAVGRWRGAVAGLLRRVSR